MEQEIHNLGRFQRKRLIAQKHNRSNINEIRDSANYLRYLVRATHDSGEDNWEVQDTRKYPYEESFKALLNGKSFTNIAEEILSKKGKVIALDLMGYGQFLENLPLSRGIAVALSDPRKKVRKQRHIDNIDIVTGNILLQRDSWKHVQDWLQEDLFDLIVARPQGGLGCLGNNPNIHFRLLQRCWRLLSREGGILFTQISEEVFSVQTVQKWIQLLDSQGIKTNVSYEEVSGDVPSLFIERGVDSPEKLPSLNL